MDAALYHPEWGYYTRPRDPFGVKGDFYTAEQLQPAFGILLRNIVQQLLPSSEATIVELGAGRGEMAPYFSRWRYLPIDVRRGALPSSFHGLVFANEFFDALPVSLIERRANTFHEVRVDYAGERFHFTHGPSVDARTASYIAKHLPNLADGQRIEVNLAALDAFDSINARLNRGYLLVIDYGYTTAELIRFPQGTLMSYRAHRASDDVLADPGERDITAHVNFTALRAHAESLHWHTVRIESLTQTLLRAGEADQFQEVLGASPQSRQHLKTLLFSMGEMFRTLLLAKNEPQT
jgi:SAM-dependent MidA family methyltransferase